MSKLASLITGQKLGQLESLTKEAAQAELEVKRLHAEDAQLSAQGFVDAYAAIPGASGEEAKRILAELGKPESEPMQSSFRRLLTAMKQWKRTSAIRRYGGYVTDDGHAELARIGCTRESLALAAAMEFARVNANTPGIFGNQSTPHGLQASIEKAVARRDDLIKQLGDRWTREDVEVLDVTDNEREAGYCRLGIRFTGNSVFVGRDLGRHLVDWQLSHGAVSKAA